MNKTVYILGAGFSFDAGVPTQDKLLTNAFELFSKDQNNFDKPRFEKFREFIKDQLNVADDELRNVELEDIFTPLDRCLSENSQFRGIGLDEIMEVREAVFYVVGKTIQLKLDETHNSQYIKSFAEYLTDLSAVRENKNYRNEDPVSVISTNWDILLDNSIHQYIQ